LSTVITILSFGFVLGVLVFVHELGHFLAAKRVGIRVLKFQLGFNPTIASFRRGDTEYGIGALPLGGYVKMAGENPEEERTGSGDEFLSKSKWERFQVLIMGPTMNLLLAVVLTAIVLFQGAEVAVFDDQPPVVGVVSAGSPAAEKDIRPGDRIVSVAGHPVDTWEQLLVAIESRSNREVSIGLLRNGLELTRQVTPRPQPGNSRFEVGDIGVLPNVHPHIKTLNPGEPADRAGIKPGDVIVAVDGHPITFSWQLRDEISKHPGTPMAVSILRSGAPQTLQVLPDKHGEIGWLGVLPADETKSIKPGPIEAVTMSVQKNAQFAEMILQTVWGLITFETSPKQLMGPVAIAQLSGESAQLGFLPLMMLMASISLNLGLLNLMPVPVLDGGHILIMAIEGLVQRDFSQRVKEKMLLAGFVVLMMLMVTVIYNDLARISWIGRLMPWK
jgi:regulator of sigma E protease